MILTNRSRPAVPPTFASQVSACSDRRTRWPAVPAAACSAMAMTSSRNSGASVPLSASRRVHPSRWTTEEFALVATIGLRWTRLIKVLEKRDDLTPNPFSHGKGNQNYHRRRRLLRIAIAAFIYRTPAAAERQEFLGPLPRWFPFPCGKGLGVRSGLWSSALIGSRPVGGRRMAGWRPESSGPRRSLGESSPQS